MSRCALRPVSCEHLGILPNGCSTPGCPAKCPNVHMACVHPGDLTQGHLSLCMWPRSTGHAQRTRLCFPWPLVGPISSSLVNILLIGAALEELWGREWLPCLPTWVSVCLQREGHKVLTFYPAANAPLGCTTPAPLSNSAKEGAVNRLQEAQAGSHLPSPMVWSQGEKAIFHPCWHTPATYVSATDVGQ